MISATGPVARQIGRGRHDLKVYPRAKRAFFNDQWRAYHPAAAADSWKRVLAFFAEHVRQEPSVLSARASEHGRRVPAGPAIPPACAVILLPDMPALHGLLALGKKFSPIDDRLLTAYRR